MLLGKGLLLVVVAVHDLPAGDAAGLLSCQLLSIPSATRFE
jgi:hypothetical protein